VVEVRRILLVLAVLGSVLAPALPAGATAACTAPRRLAVTGATIVEGTVRGGHRTLTFTVTSSGCAQRGSVRFGTVGYTARVRDDFVSRTGELAYEPGQQGSRSVSVQVVADAIAEATECFSLQLAVTAGALRADPAEAAGIIRDDDRRSGAPRGFICSE